MLVRRIIICFSAWPLLLLGLILWLPSLVKAQDNDLAEIRNEFTRQNGDLLREKVYLHTDREAYLCGEILWFKAYMVAGRHTLNGLSKVLYVELIDGAHKPVLQLKIGLKEGVGDGSVYLPFTINSGNYELRAYTSLMKNFGPGSYFHKNICVVNTQQSDSQQGTSSRINNYAISIRTEGGNLIDGIESKVAVKVTGSDGKGTGLQGVLLDSKNDTVARFQCHRYGIGTFTFTPDSREKYTVAFISSHRRVATASLPEIKKSGYVLSLRQGAGKVFLDVKSNSAGSSAVVLLGHSHDHIYFSQQKTLSGGLTRFEVDDKALAEGITCFTLFDSERKPVAERLFFKFPDTGNVKATTNLNARVFAKRQKVSVAIGLNDRQLKPVAGNLSLSVYLGSSNLGRTPTDIESYLLLCADINEPIEDAGSYLSAENDRETLADDLMLCSGWNGQYRDKQLYLPEYEGHLIAATLRNPVSGLPIKDTYGFLSVPGKKVWLYASMSDSTGLIRFNTKNLYGRNELIFQVSPEFKDSCRADFLSPFSDSFSSARIPTLGTFNDSLEAVVSATNLNMQVLNVFSADRLRRFVTPLTDSDAFFGKPDKTYMLDDYTRFTTTEEVLREFIPEIWLFRREGDLKMRVINDQTRGLFDVEPMMLIDGVPFFRSARILHYDPLKIKSIDIVTKRYVWGPASFDGIVNFKTYEGNMTGFSLDPKDIVIDYEGLLEQRKFYMPEYLSNDQVNSSFPDFRNLLFWSPNIYTDKVTGRTRVEFYTSDQKGTYVGSLQGITDDGSLINQSFSFTVK